MRCSFAIVAGALALVASSLVYALDVTRTPMVGPESGENSSGAAQIIGLARLKVGTGTATGNSVTINNASGIITTASLSTAAGATQAITLTSNKIQAGDMVFGMVDPNGSTGTPVIANTAVSAGQAVFLIQNIHASAPLNAAVKVMFLVVTKGNPN